MGGRVFLISFDSLMFHQAMVLLAFSPLRKVWPLLPEHVGEEEGVVFVRSPCGLPFVEA